MINAELEQLLTTLPPGDPPGDRETFEHIECSELDGQHRKWLGSYVFYCRESLQQEVERPIPDLTMVGFYRRELLKYHELLARI